MAMKLALLACPVPLAAVLLLPPAPTADTRDGTEEERACATAGAHSGHATVRVPWKRIDVVLADVDVLYCVLRGDPGSPLAFERDADRIRFTLIGRGEHAKDGSFSFEVRTSAGRTIVLGPAAVHIAPGGRRSCRVEICQAFTDPGERVLAAGVRIH